MPDTLQAEAWDTTSQRGEDGVIAAIFDRIGWPSTTGFCVECGAGDGRKNSNSWRLIVQCDWVGVQIEADRARFAALRETYRDYNVRCINTMVAPGPIGGMDDVLDGEFCPMDPDLMVIDVDGCDWWIWHHLVRYRPRVVMGEFNPTMPFWQDVKQPADPRIQAGCSLGALVALGRRKGYELAAVTSWNALFVLADDLPKIGIADNSPWTIARHLVEGYSFLCQDYTGSVRFAGNQARIWGPVGNLDVAGIEAAANIRRG
jgi:hypothetical protein